MRGSGIALTAAVGGVLLVPATPLAGEPPTAPTAVLDAASTTVTAGAPVRLDSSASRAGTGAIVGHVWDLDGNGSFETDTGSTAAVEATPKAPGKLTVHVRVVDDRGQNGDAELDLTVTGPPKMENGSAIPPKSMTADGPGTTHADEPAPAAGDESGGTTHPGYDAPSQPADPSPTRATTPLAPISAARVSSTPDLVPRPALTSRTAAAANTRPVAQVTAAASTGVTIKNFKFSPASSSVHTGDTITWTNQDQAPHTATANDGSFDTGTINQGKSGSHTFSKAGTFSYICSIHPSMKGTVTVLGASSGGGSGGGNSGGSSSSGSNGSGSSSGGSGLPQTGLDIAVVVLIAALMMGSGTLLRQAARRGR
jgi:plastocyanin